MRRQTVRCVRSRLRTWSVSSHHGQIQVDERRNTIVLPINGFAVPFHINTLKSVVKQEEAGGGYSTLRLMFVTPGQIAGKKEDTVRRSGILHLGAAYAPAALRGRQRQLYPWLHLPLY